LLAEAALVSEEEVAQEEVMSVGGQEGFKMESPKERVEQSRHI
jgi:hypothetical protein